MLTYVPYSAKCAVHWLSISSTFSTASGVIMPSASWNTLIRAGWNSDFTLSGGKSQNSFKSLCFFTYFIYSSIKSFQYFHKIPISGMFKSSNTVSDWTEHKETNLQNNYKRKAFTNLIVKNFRLNKY